MPATPDSPAEARPRPLRVVVAGGPEMRQARQACLARAGHLTIAALTAGQAAEQCRLARPDLVVADVGLAGLDALAADGAFAEVPVPILLVGELDDAAPIEELALSVRVMAYLPGAAPGAALAAAASLAVRLFETADALRREAAGLRQALEERRLIERAKGALTRRLGVEEDEAFLMLRLSASGKRVKLVEEARGVLAAEAVFSALEQCLSGGDGALGGGRHGPGRRLGCTGFCQCGQLKASRWLDAHSERFPATASSFKVHLHKRG